ncbi:hypothetical protein, partial [Halalkalibacter lacteus]|uniref:hypothetical protein n=1 Tax=Halalkalibacter lacteus TaxID=3090663 RepID=UPI002FC63ADD
WEALARFIERHPERTGRPEDRIRSFVVWRLFTSTAERGRRDPAEDGAELGRALLGNEPPIVLRFAREDGVPDAERMTDGSL